MIAGSQIRAARALLNWTQTDLAVRANVAAQTIRLFESGSRRPHEQTLADIQRALEDAGIEFLQTDIGQGILLRSHLSM